MSGYQVEFSEEAIEDLDSSFEWGCERWGEEQAVKWYLNMRETIEKELVLFPLRYSLAPENEEYSVEVRQLIKGRYRVLFNISRKIITVLHIRGPYT